MQRTMLSLKTLNTDFKIIVKVQKFSLRLIPIVFGGPKLVKPRARNKDGLGAYGEVQ